MGNDKKRELDAVTTGAGDLAVVETLSELTIDGALPPKVGSAEEPDVTVSDTVGEALLSARGSATTVISGGITDQIQEAGTHASASDVLEILTAHASALSTGEREVVESMTAQLHAGESADARQLQTWEYHNVFTGKDVRLRIGWVQAMRPSDSTELLVTYMRITPGESVLDVGTGTGVIAIAAHELGAGSITASDLHGEFADEIGVNLRLNRLSTPERASVRILFGDMFSPVLGEMFDHVISNPASIPCPPGEHLDIHYDSGTEGRDIIDRLLKEVSMVLKPGGQLTMVHGSLSDMPRTLRMLSELGFTGIEISEPKELPFKDFYPTEYLKLLKAQGKAEFREEQCPDGSFKYFETRCVITAKWAERPK